MVNITFTWNTTQDERTCHETFRRPFGCYNLDGYKWVFDSTIPDFLVYNGVAVWDLLRNISVVHSPEEQANCRCYLTVTVSLADIDEKIRQLTAIVIATRILPQVEQPEAMP